ncbi:hypothetical protein [Thiolapillus sp.]|nr:hypothetical protein [Thiolapillus sp.]
MAALLVGCSIWPNKHQIAEMVLSHHASPAWMDIQDFRIIKEIETAKRYVIDVSYTLLPKIDASRLIEKRMRNEGYDPSANDEKTTLRRKEIRAAIAGSLGDFQAGDKLQIHEEITLIKNKQGWYIQSTYRPADGGLVRIPTGMPGGNDLAAGAQKKEAGTLY